MNRLWSIWQISPLKLGIDFVVVPVDEGSVMNKVYKKTGLFFDG